jgi:hypothetical protein
MSDTFDYTDGGTASKADSTSTSKAKEPSILAKLREEVSKKIERPDVVIQVPERPSISIRFSPNVTQTQLNAWRRNAGDNTKAGMDATKFACSVIGHTCRGILVDGEDAVNDDGAVLTFASPEILEMLDASRPMPDAVRAMYGLDPHVEAVALAIMEAAGYNDSVDTVDPT